MKNRNLRLLSLASLFVLVGIISCKKDNDGPSTGMSATINGTAFQPSFVGGILQNEYITIAGTQFKSGDTLILDVSVPDTAHVNNVMDLYDAELHYGNVRGTKVYTSANWDSHGTVTLTNWDKNGKKIAGKFSGVLYSAINSNDSVVITNGQFNSSYQQ